MSPRALLLSAHAATLEIGHQVMGALDISCQTTPSLAGPLDAELDLLLFDLDIDLEASPEKFAADAAARFPHATLVAVAGQDSRKRLLQAIHHPNVGHALPKQLAPSGSGVRFEGPDGRDLFVALRRRARPELRGVAPYLLDGAAAAETAILHTDDRAGALAEVVALAQRVQLRDEKLRRVELLAEELICNALYDASLDSGGKPRVRDGADAQVHIAFGCDGTSLALSVTDRFGGLRRGTVVESLAQLLNPRDTAGPRRGVGLMMAFGAANHLAFQVVPGERSEVIAVVDVGRTNRMSQARGTALSFLLPA